MTWIKLKFSTSHGEINQIESISVYDFLVLATTGRENYFDW